MTADIDAPDAIAAIIAKAGVLPIRAPRSGAEAVLFTSPPEVAKKTLRDVLADLAALHDRLLDLADEITAQLDAIDGDADLEPTLGAGERQWWWLPPLEDGKPECIDDIARWRQGDADEREPDEDHEPILGSVPHTNQRWWAMGCGGDIELEHDGREPSMGWSAPVFGVPTPWAPGNADLEV